MPPTLAPVDRQATWFPTWVIESPAFPHLYALRDLSVPAVGGDPFITGDSDTGGTDEIGGGSGPDALHAWGRIIESPTITRRISDPFWPLVDVQDGSAKVAGLPSGDYRGQPITVSRYDAVSGLRLYEAQAIITRTVMDREGTVIEWTTVDRAILEEQVPVGGVITTAAFPQAAPEALGQTIPWLFGNVTSLPLLCVRDDQVNNIFDYIVCRGTAAAITGVRRLSRDPATQASFDVDFIELEPYPGMDGVLVNGGQEDWDSGTTVAADSWVLAGGGSSIAKNITAGQFSEGSASASVTRAANNVTYSEDLLANAPTLPLSWWRGREMTVAADLRAAVAATVYVRATDSAGSTLSTTHSGGGTFEAKTATRTLDAAATSVSIAMRIETTNQTAQIDNVKVYLKAKSWAEIPRTDLYPGYTAVRFYLRQEDSTGALHQLVVDINGLQPERNPVRAIRTLLSDATHSIGKTVDAAIIDAAEVAACLSYESAVLLDAPELLLMHRDRKPRLDLASTLVCRDRSGHERHGVYNLVTTDALVSGNEAGDSFSFPTVSGGSLNASYLELDGLDGSYVSVPWDRAFDGTSITVELWHYQTLAADPRPMFEKMNSAAAQSGAGFYRSGGNIIFFVNSNGGTVTTLTVAQDASAWHLYDGVASGGVLTMYRDGLLVATGSYPGTLDTPTTGAPIVYVGRFGTPSAATVGADLFKGEALYSTALSAERIAAHAAAKFLDAEDVDTFSHLIQVQSPTFVYVCDDAAASAVMAEETNGGMDGSWVGTPTLGVEGPLNPERGFVSSGAAVRFSNNGAQYGVKTGETLANNNFSFGAFYKPSGLMGNCGIIEKTIAGVRDTQWGLCQRKAGGSPVIRATIVTTSGTFTNDIPLTADDVGRYGWYLATYRVSDGQFRVFKAGALVAEGLIAGTPVSGVGDFYVGIQGTAGGGLTRPARGDIGRVFYCPSRLTTGEVSPMWTAATWYNGGNLVDAAMTEPRQLQDWLAQFAQLRGIRLGFTAAGAITCSVDTAPTEIFYDARDGAGDGERNIVAISGRQRPGLDDMVKDVVVKYRLDLVTQQWLGEIRRAVSTTLDAHGNRIGRDRPFYLDGVREHFTADRFADYAAKRLIAGEDSVEVTLHQEARRLTEGALIQVTDALMDYASELMEVREVRKELATITATLQGWDEDVYTYEPAAFPPGATSG